MNATRWEFLVWVLLVALAALMLTACATSPVKFNEEGRVTKMSGSAYVQVEALRSAERARTMRMLMEQGDMACERMEATETGMVCLAWVRNTPSEASQRALLPVLTGEEIKAMGATGQAEYFRALQLLAVSGGGQLPDAVGDALRLALDPQEMVELARIGGNTAVAMENASVRRLNAILWPAGIIGGILANHLGIAEIVEAVGPTASQSIGTISVNSSTDPGISGGGSSLGAAAGEGIPAAAGEGNTALEQITIAPTVGGQTAVVGASGAQLNSSGSTSQRLPVSGSQTVEDAGTGIVGDQSGTTGGGAFNPSQDEQTGFTVPGL